MQFLTGKTEIFLNFPPWQKILYLFDLRIPAAGSHIVTTHEKIKKIIWLIIKLKWVLSGLLPA